MSTDVAHMRRDWGGPPAWPPSHPSVNGAVPAALGSLVSRPGSNASRVNGMSSFGSARIPASPNGGRLEGPPTGDGRYYLSRGVARCLTYGDSSLDPDPRDDLDAVDPCP